MELRERLADVHRRPGAYGLRTFDQAAAFVMGFDAATEWEFLHGFQEWLAGECGGGENLVWPKLVERLAFREADVAVETDGSGDNFERLFSLLFDSLERFLDARHETGSLDHA